MACFFGHKWNGCICKKCGEKRDEGHDWDGCKCKLCGDVRDANHNWNSSTCRKCGKKNSYGHKYAPVAGECMERCEVCGEEKERHSFVREEIKGDVEYCYTNICSVCGKREKVAHSFKAMSPGIGKALTRCACGLERIQPHEHRFWCNQCDYCGAYDDTVKKQGDFYTAKSEYSDTVNLVGYQGKECAKIVIPEGVYGISMGHMSNFSGNNDIVEVVFPSTLRRTGMHTFSGCKNLKKVTINQGLETIDQSAFSGCSSLLEINIPDTVKNIESSAFSGCKALKEIYIPSSVLDFRFNPFSGCPALTITCHEGSAAHRFAKKEKISYKLLPKDPKNPEPAVPPKVFTNTQQSGVIRHVVCICCNHPLVNQWKPKIQDFILDKETKSGSTINSMSRITFDCFYDNAHLQNDESLKMQLMKVYGETYGFGEAQSLALKSVYKGEMKQDGSSEPMAKFFVLYE